MLLRTTSTTRPALDRTCGSSIGHYIYARPSGHMHGSAARIISPMYANLNGSQCFTFWYYMYGRNVGLLTVYASMRKPTAPEDMKVVLWNTRGEGRRAWLKASFEVPRNSAYGGYRIIFEAVAGGGTDEADIAIDDVSVAEGSCNGSNGDRAEVNERDHSKART